MLKHIVLAEQNKLRTDTSFFYEVVFRYVVTRLILTIDWNKEYYDIFF